MQARVPLLIAVAIFISSAASAADLTPTQLLEKVRASGGDNPRLQSGQGEISEVVELQPPNPAEIEKEVETYFSKMKSLDPNDAQYKDLKIQAGKFRQSLSEPARIQRKYRITFSGDHSGGLLRQEARQPGAMGDFRVFSTTLSSGAQSSDGGATIVLVDNRVTVMRRHGANMLRDMGRMPANSTRIPDFLQSFARQGESVRLLADEKIDGHVCRVLTIGNAITGEVRSKLWTDPARGFICPRSESYGSSGRLVTRTESSGYFLEPSSKLWFAEEQTQTNFDPRTGKQTQTTHSHLNRETLKVNEPISAAEFVIVLEKGSTINDQREGGRDWLANETVRLAFSEGTLELDRFPGLTPTSAARSKSFGSFSADSFGAVARVVLLSIACIPPLLLLGAVLIVRRITSKRRVEVRLPLRTPDSVH